MSRRRAPQGDPDDWLTRKEAALLASCHTNTIRNWASSGILPEQKVKVGNREEARYLRADLDAAMEGREKTGPREGPGSALMLPPSRLWEMVQSSAQEATEARERAASAEAEARVLREQIATMVAAAAQTATAPRRRWFSGK